MMERLTERDEYGNANIIGVDSAEFQLNLDFDDFNRVTNALNKLAEYEDLEEQGKLLKPKCLPGDYVWEINKKRKLISEYEVSSVRYGINKTFHYMWTLRNGIYGDLEGFADDKIGKTVFLTKPDAEQALKEM